MKKFIGLAACAVVFIGAGALIMRPKNREFALLPADQQSLHDAVGDCQPGDVSCVLQATRADAQKARDAQSSNHGDAAAPGTSSPGSDSAGISNSYGSCRITGMALSGQTDFECETRGQAFQRCGGRKDSDDSLNLARVRLRSDGIHPSLETKMNGEPVKLHTLWAATGCGITAGVTTDDWIPAFHQLFGSGHDPKHRNDCFVEFDAQQLPAPDATGLYCRNNTVYFQASPRVQGVTSPDYIEIGNPRRKDQELKLFDCTLGSENPDSIVPLCKSAQKLEIQADGTIVSASFSNQSIRLEKTDCSNLDTTSNFYDFGTCFERAAKKAADPYRYAESQIH